MDVKAALKAGAGALGVTTGICSAESLEAAGREGGGVLISGGGGGGESAGKVVVLESLEDTAGVLAALGLA